MNILVLGPQGSGKGTQAKRIAATYGIPHIATGDMLREMKELPTDLGRELKEVMDRGDLVNDELMIRLIRDRLSRGDTLAGFVLDGFPRTMPQAEALDELLARARPRCSTSSSTSRSPTTRCSSSGCSSRAAEEGRSDDTPEAMKRRLELYDRETRAAHRLLPHAAGECRRPPRRPQHRRGLRGDPALARLGGGRAA